MQFLENQEDQHSRLLFLKARSDAEMMDDLKSLRYDNKVLEGKVGYCLELLTDSESDFEKDEEGEEEEEQKENSAPNGEESGDDVSACDEWDTHAYRWLVNFHSNELHWQRVGVTAAWSLRMVYIGAFIERDAPGQMRV